MKFFNLICGLTLLAFGCPAFAVFQCNVTVQKVLIYEDGSVNVYHTGRGDYTYICSLSEERKGVSIQTCAMWASMLQNIKKNSGIAQLYYSGEGSCATLPTYASSPAPTYIGDI